MADTTQMSPEVLNLTNEIEQLKARINELNHHKVALDSAFMEQVQTSVNHKVAISQLSEQLQIAKNTIDSHNNIVESKNKEIQRLSEIAKESCV